MFDKGCQVTIFSLFFSSRFFREPEIENPWLEKASVHSDALLGGMPRLKNVCTFQTGVFNPRQFILSLLWVSFLFLSSSTLQAQDLSLGTWRLWPDTRAAWQDDALYLPDQVDLSTLPVNPPTGGWKTLNDQKGIPITLPSTVEEHYWGKFGLRPYDNDYGYSKTDDQAQNGNYPGVSWWWRRFTAPHPGPGERVVAHFRGARQRAEVYCNGKLCGYSLLAELPFDADLTDALHPGSDNLLAVRITNPGGQMDWRDAGALLWGKNRLPRSHGFGGLDAGIELEVRAPLAVTDLAALNHPNPSQVSLLTEVTGTGEKFQGRLLFRISREGRIVWTGNAPLHLAAGQRSASVETEVEIPNPALWDLVHPNLYRVTAQVEGVAHSEQGREFGLRWFTAEGIGKDARLTLNGKRIVLRSAISWGFWGANGLWPDTALAEREVRDAQALGLNCLQSHRNLSRSEVLDAQDRLGLLRYEEPGCGEAALGQNRVTASIQGPIDIFGKGGEIADFTAHYEEQKILEMVRRDRSHPSLLLYCLQNELNVDLHTPRIFYLLRSVHALDPSRIVVLHSGIKANNQAWMLPYDDTVYSDDGTGVSGWHDEHSVGGAGAYKDNLYLDPDDFSHSGADKLRPGKEGASPTKPEVVMYGEMLGAGTPDDHQAIVDAYHRTGRDGYDRADQERILAAYNDFLDRYHFRQAFPTASSLFHAIGSKSYFLWQKMIEQCRFANTVDYMVLSGWESTSIEDHAGLVDVHRNFKADPEILRRATDPELLAIRARHLVLAQGDTGIADLFLINETNRTGPQHLTFTVRNAAGKLLLTRSFDVEATGGDVYGQLLQSGVEFPTMEAGMLTLQADLTPTAGKDRPLHREEQVLVVDTHGPDLPENIAIQEPKPLIAPLLSSKFETQALGPADLSGPLDAVLLSAHIPTTPPEKEPSLPGPIQVRTRPQAPTLWETQLDTVLPRVYKEGVRLVLWTDTGPEAAQFAQALDRRKIVRFEGMVGTTRASWMGSWYFVRKHWLFDGLPTDCALDWRYQVTADRFNGDGLLLSAPGMEVVVGYGRDHDAHIGIGACVIPYGKGKIVLFCLPGLNRALTGDAKDIDPVVALRLLGNALR